MKKIKDGWSKDHGGRPILKVERLQICPMLMRGACGSFKDVSRRFGVVWERRIRVRTWRRALGW